MIEENKALQKRANEAIEEAARKKRITESEYLRVLEENRALKKYVQSLDEEHGAEVRPMFSPVINEVSIHIMRSIFAQTMSFVISCFRVQSVTHRLHQSPRLF